MTTYKTLKGTGKAAIEAKGSKFIAYANPVETEEKANEFIARIRQLHPNANHNVPAYRFTSRGKLALYFSDDGEPSGSSGKPIFKVLEMKDLTDLVIVVTRYFGGTKLGFGGLARAYRQAAIEAIEDAGIVEKCETIEFSVISSYSDLQTIRILVSDWGVILNEEYSDKVQLSILVPKEKKEQFTERLLTSGLELKIKNLD